MKPMETREGETGYTKKREPGNAYIASLRKKYGLPEDASLQDIELVAVELLRDKQDPLGAASLVLNRYVGTEERAIGEMTLFGGSPEEIVDLLILQFANEETLRKKGVTDFGTTNSLMFSEK